MNKNTPLIHIGILGSSGTDGQERHGGGLWPAGYAAALTAANAEPVWLGETAGGRSLDQLLAGLHGVVLAGHREPSGRLSGPGEKLCQWCGRHRLPLLAIDQGLHILNQTYGGSLYNDLPRELPEALQHRHPPERGLRHAINVVPDTRLADIYGEGEVVVNSEHRRAVQRVARGFHVSAHALDGVIEAIEADAEGWFAMGVQWQPASCTASGLDIQLFRGLVDACSQPAAVLEEELCGSAA